MILYIGNHTSSSKGYAAMGRQMLKNRWKHVCFFLTRNPRGGKAKEIDPADVERFLELSRENHFGNAGGTCTVYHECLCRKRKSERFCKRDHGR